MPIKKTLISFWDFLRKDTWPSFFVSLILIVIFIKLIFFPALTIITGAPLPLVVVESCSMYHTASFQGWWERNKGWYEQRNVTLADFEEFPLKNGLNKGDIVIVWGKGEMQRGDIIIFSAKTRYPVIHRVITENPRATKGDNNPDQLLFERTISDNALMGKAVAKIPYLGWIKLIFFEALKEPNSRGFCN